MVSVDILTLPTTLISFTTSAKDAVNKRNEYKIEYNNVLIIEKGSYTYTVCFQPNQFADFIYFVN